ncbi:MAG TPA: hypothetical protein VIC55_02240 [Gemmatimonadaceae bacterium]|jgi:hypothetical protein
MQRPLFVMGAALLLAGPPVAAQQQGPDPQCQGQSASDACQKALDLFRYMNTQLGTLIAGGNATLGQGGTLGGLGHVSVGVRANVLQASVPNAKSVDTPGIGPALSTPYTTSSKYVALPEVDAAIGVFRGFPIGVTYIGGLDALVSAAYLPSFEQDGVNVSNSVGALRFGFGARVGVLQETVLTPGISVTYLERNLPMTTIQASASNTASFGVQGLDLRAKSWRVVASKSIIAFGLAVGFGRDYYDANANLTYNVNGVQPTAPIQASESPTRTSMFGDLSFNLIPFIKFVGEVGRVSSGSVTTYNTFDRNANDARWYGSVGAHLVF